MAMLDETVLEQVITLMADLRVAKRAKMEPHSTLDGDLGLDHYARMLIWTNYQSKFRVKIPKQEVLQWSTIADITRSIERAPFHLSGLQYIAARVERDVSDRKAAQDIIEDLVAYFGADFNRTGSTNVLRCGGATGTCTSSADIGLLDSWRRCAARRIKLETGL